MAVNVGSISVGMNVDLAEFQRGMSKATDTAKSNVQNMSAEMKRTSKEGSESLRIIDEALGVHISRPVARIVTQEFPGVAKAFQSILGAGVTGAVLFAGIEAISSAVEKLQKKFDAARKAQLEYEEAARHLSQTLQEVAASHEKRLLQMNAELAALSGDRQGALADRLKIASIDNAEQLIQQIDQIAQAMERLNKAAIEASTSSHRFWLALRQDWSSEHNLSLEGMDKGFADFKEKLKDVSRIDAAQGTTKGLELARQKAKELDDQLAAAQQNRISDLRAFFDDSIKAVSGLGTNAGKTDKEIAQIKGQRDEAAALLKAAQDSKEEADRRTQLIRKQAAAEPEIGAKEIEKLKSETAAQLALAGTLTQSTAAQRLQSAAGEADQLVSRILEEAHGKLTARIKEEMTTIRALTAERQVAKDAIATNQELDKQLLATQNQIESEKKLAQAYRESGDAVLAAKIDEKLAPAIQTAKTLREEFELLKKAADDYASSGGKLGIKGISAGALATEKGAADAADQKLAQLQIEATAEARQKYQVDIEQNAAAIAAEKPLLDSLNAAYMQGAEAVRHAQTALALYHYEQAHPGATPEQIAAVSAQLEAQSVQARRNSDAELAARYSITRAYEDEINQLLRAKEVLQSYGQSTILVDAQIYDSQLRLIQQWDDAALKVGDFGQKTTAVFNDLVLQGKQAGENIARAFMQAIDSSETQLAKLLTGQKADFKGVVTNLAEQVTKAKIQQGVGALAEHFGFGDLLKGKPDGTDTNPLHVVIKGSSPSLMPGQSAPLEGGGLAGLISGFFGGFKATGGDLTPGKAYVVGEQGPELLTVPHAGSITSNADMRKMTVSNRGGDVHSTNITQNFGNAKDSDMFRRTVRQENARMFRHLK